MDLKLIQFDNYRNYTKHILFLASTENRTHYMTILLLDYHNYIILVLSNNKGSFWRKLKFMCSTLINSAFKNDESGKRIPKKLS